MLSVRHLDTGTSIKKGLLQVRHWVTGTVIKKGSVTSSSLGQNALSEDQPAVSKISFTGTDEFLAFDAAAA